MFMDFVSAISFFKKTRNGIIEYVCFGDKLHGESYTTQVVVLLPQIFVKQNTN